MGYPTTIRPGESVGPCSRGDEAERGELGGTQIDRGFGRAQQGHARARNRALEHSSTMPIVTSKPRTRSERSSRTSATGRRSPSGAKARVASRCPPRWTRSSCTSPSWGGSPQRQRLDGQFPEKSSRSRVGLQRALIDGGWLCPCRPDEARCASVLRLGRRGALANDVLRLLVSAQAEQRRVPQVTIGRPFDELNLRDDLRRNPVCCGELETLRLGREGACTLVQRLQLFAQSGQEIARKAFCLCPPCRRTPACAASRTRRGRSRRIPSASLSARCSRR